MHPDSTVKFRTVKHKEVFIELVRATPLGGNRFRLDSSPGYADGVSLGDVVLAPLAKGQPQFRKVVTKSGMQTLRILFDEDVVEGNEAEKTLKGLASFGCSSERIQSRRYAVNVPANMKLEAVTQFLSDGYTAWEYADPCPETSGMKKLLRSMFSWR